jgi:CRP-like cAMP-binding protein
MAILDHGPRSATVVVSYEARLLSLSGESFKDLMIQMPEIAFEICSSLSTRIRGLERGQRSGDDSIPSLSVPG